MVTTNKHFVSNRAYLSMTHLCSFKFYLGYIEKADDDIMTNRSMTNLVLRNMKSSFLIYFSSKVLYYVAFLY
jgi:hypothetical protein